MLNLERPSANLYLKSPTEWSGEVWGGFGDVPRRSRHNFASRDGVTCVGQSVHPSCQCPSSVVEHLRDHV